MINIQKNDFINMTKLKSALDTYIFNDDTMREKRGKDILKRLKFTFDDKIYVDSLDKSDKRWIDDDISTIIEGLLEFINKI